MGALSSCPRAWGLQLLVQFCVLGACSAITKAVCLGLWVVCSDKFSRSVSNMSLWGLAARLGPRLLEELELLNFAVSLLLNTGIIHRLLQGLYKACVFYSIIPKIWPVGNHSCAVCQDRALKEVPCSFGALQQA